MEPSSVSKAPRGSLEDPEVFENVPGHVIPILEREFDDFDTEAEKFLRRRDARGPSSSASASSRASTASASPTCRCAASSCRWAAITPEQMEAFADVIEEYAPLNKAHITTRQNIQIHHIPLRQMAELIRELAPSGCPAARAAATPCAT